MASKKNDMYDTIIIGAGPAGMTAAIFAARYKLKALIISKDTGGVANMAHKVENWPGILSITGEELMQSFKKQVGSLGIEIVTDEVDKIINNFEITTSGGKRFKAKTLILALGTVTRKLNIPGEDEFIGKGVSYCTSCDAPLFKNKTVSVVGGRNAAVMATLLLAEYAKKVYLIYRGKPLQADPCLVEQAEKNKKAEIMYNSEVSQILGKKFVEKIKLKDGKEMPMDGIFVQIGGIPSTVLAKELNIKLDEQGYILIDANMMTNVPSVFAAGDITTTPLRQIITASAEGAKAAYSVFNYLKTKPCA